MGPATPFICFPFFQLILLNERASKGRCCMRKERFEFIGKELVGERRFELPTSWSRTKRATRLRYSPIVF